MSANALCEQLQQRKIVQLIKGRAVGIVRFFVKSRKHGQKLVRLIKTHLIFTMSYLESKCVYNTFDISVVLELKDRYELAGGSAEHSRGVPNAFFRKISSQLSNEKRTSDLKGRV